MEFGESGLPQDPRIERCFDNIRKFYKASGYKDPDEMVISIVKTGEVLTEAFPDKAAPIPLICAAFLMHLKKDSYEYDNIRHDYGHDVFLAVKAQASFTPLFKAPEFLGEALQDPEVHRDVRIFYMAQSIAAIRALNINVRNNPETLDDPGYREYYESWILIGNGCRRAHGVLDYLFDKEIITFHALPQEIATAEEAEDESDHDEPFVPSPPRNNRPKPTLH